MKIDLLIKGDLLATEIAMGGGIYAAQALPEDWDASGAIILQGSVRLDSIESKGRTVLVLGHIASLKEGGAI